MKQLQKVNEAMPGNLRLTLYIISFILLSSCVLTPPVFNEKRWLETVDNTDPKDLHLPNEKDGVFFNPWLAPEDRSFFRFLRWRLSRPAKYSDDAQEYKPQVQPDLIGRIKLLPDSSNFIAWVGHATFLMRINGSYWLTDPIFSDRAFLPKRITPPAITAMDLRSLRKPIRVILSHNHYDHLDKKSLSQLPEGTKYYVPKGLKNYVKSLITAGVVEEMNWWDKKETGAGFLTCLPAQHWSRRLFQGYNTTLWASYMIESGGLTIYFGGDSGYFKGYSEIGRQFPTINYALLPITAYDPRWFMHYPHMNTLEAIRAFNDLGADYFVPTQWGTFHLGDNPPGLPALDMKKDISEMHLEKSRYLFLDIGQILPL